MIHAEPCPAPEPEPNKLSDQVHEFAKVPVSKRVLMVFEGMDGRPAHTPATVCEFNVDPGNLLDYNEEVNSLFLLPPLVPSGQNPLVPPLVLPSPESPTSPVSWFLLTPALQGSHPASLSCFLSKKKPVPRLYLRWSGLSSPSVSASRAF